MSPFSKSNTSLPACMTAQRYRMTLILLAASPSPLRYHETSPACPYQPHPFVTANKMALFCSLHLISHNSHTFSCLCLGLIIIFHSVNKFSESDTLTQTVCTINSCIVFNCTERKNVTSFVAHFHTAT